MTEYMPKVGDKVRATLGSTTFEAFVIGTDGEGVDVRSEAFGRDALETYLEDADGWHFEQVVTVPSKFGAVIRRADGELFTSFGVDNEWWANPDEIFITRKATEGGFDILFEGADE